MSDPRFQGPINPIPPVVFVLAGLVAAAEVVFQIGSTGMVGGPQAIGWRLWAANEVAVLPQHVERLVLRGDVSPGTLFRFVAYPFVHAGLTHAVFAGVLLLALGKFVGDVFRTASMLILFFGGAIFGALIYGAVISEPVPLYGAYPPVYAIIGGFTYLMWLRLGALGQSQIRAFSLIAFLLGIQLLFGLLFGGNPTWVADVAAFVWGLGVSPLLAPGGWSSFLRRMRGGP